ncbi:SRPBCC family protein [Tenggerimyces flavus]|uniref:SRPBCC family protein n=1 Tax=Tenggerimyces flavus TaxID=1708749 RepID=A0ABV7YLW5_9ACTN|nr:SRPBCC family protein [Tenggerimyces flavus]MBM7789488.1 uncharacterized protein YndB with AHSA1/START domain [Tenggerimyces flavus]
MRRLFQVDTVIDRPVAEVWTELTAWDRAPRWMNGVDTMRVDGTTVTYEARGKTIQAEITAIEPGRSVTIVNKQGGVTAQYVYKLSQEGERTRATLTADLQISGFPTVLLGPVIRTAIKRTDSGQLQNLREVLERAGTRDST